VQIREAPARLFNELTRLAVGGLKAIADEDIDTSDIPEASEMFFRKAKVKYFNPTSSSMWFWEETAQPRIQYLDVLCYLSRPFW